MKKLILLPLILVACAEPVKQLTPEELEEKRLRDISDRKIDSLNRRIDSIKTENKRIQIEYKRKLR